MYIRGLIPRNSAESAEAVSIEGSVSLQHIDLDSFKYLIIQLINVQKQTKASADIEHAGCKRQSDDLIVS